MSGSNLPRTVLPIPGRQRVCLARYDAKDPDTSYPPIEPLRPPAAPPNVLLAISRLLGALALGEEEGDPGTAVSRRGRRAARARRGAAR
jgi:hypothetical protein